MIYRELGTTGITVSAIAFGAWQIGGFPFWQTKGDENSIAAIEKAFDLGVNFFDTAPAYGFGHSEKIVGATLKKRRDKVILATKCGLLWREERLDQLYRRLKPESVRREAEESLRRLQTDYIDLYQIHWPSPDEPVEPALEVMLRLKEEGKIRAIGVSNFDLPLLQRALAAAPVDCLQPKYNLLERDAGKEILPFCAERKIGVIAYSPLASGLLTGKYKRGAQFGDWRDNSPFGVFNKSLLGKAFDAVDRLNKVAEIMGQPLAHIALNWVLANKAVTSAIVGTKDAQQVQNSVLCLERSLTREGMERVDEAGRLS